jgi:hypothetical protein
MERRNDYVRIDYASKLRKQQRETTKQNKNTHHNF